jgi:hypothetical protein
MSGRRWNYGDAVQQKVVQTLLGLTIVIAVIVALYLSIRAIIGFLSSLDQPLIVAILAASVTIITSTITVVVGRFLERKKEIEAYFRQRKQDQYDEMLSIIYSSIETGGQATIDEGYVKRLREWQKKLILFAGPKTIRAFVAWMSFLKAGAPTIRTIILMEEFFKSLRTDLGLSNRGLQLGDFAQLMLKHGDLFVAAAKSNPSMLLSELAALEKIVEQKQSPMKSPADGPH